MFVAVPTSRQRESEAENGFHANYVSRKISDHARSSTSEDLETRGDEDQREGGMKRRGDKILKEWLISQPRQKGSHTTTEFE